METSKYLKIKKELENSDFKKHIKWCELLIPCDNAITFWTEYTFVICNSGMKNTIAVVIFNKIMKAYENGQKASDVFGHKGKAKAIDDCWIKREEYFSGWKKVRSNIDYFETLPWIGKITKYHLAKNLGVDVCKPDRHLVRIAKKYNLSPHELCFKLANKTGDKMSLVDLILWKAGSLKWI